MIKTIFMGTPEFAVEALKYVDENTDLKLIFTKEDKLNARGNKVIYSPVKQYALDHGIECVQPKSVRTDDVLNMVKDINPDLIIVAAYGKIIPKNLIDIPRLGIINVHSSILPKYRGASPIHSALLNGDETTGISIMMIDEGLDTGDVLEVEEISIDYNDNLGTLSEKLAKISVKPLKVAIDKLIAGTETRVKQDNSKASIVKPISKEETKINWNESSEKIRGLVRALNPKPCAYTELNGSRIKVYEVKVVDKEYNSIGKVVELTKKGPIISTKDGGLLILSAKFEGKKVQSGIDIVNGRKMSLGDEFDE